MTQSEGMPELLRLLFELHARTPGFQRKVRAAQAFIKEALAQMQRPYIAYSTGKDSSCVAHLIWSVQPSIPAVYFDADCAFPESYALLDRMEAQGYPMTRWKTEPLLDTFARLGGIDAPGIEQATMESTVYAPIRALLAEHSYDGVFVGLRAQESEGRAKSARFHGPLYRYKRDGVLRCLPCATWTYRDVWSYIVAHDLDYNTVYDRMWELSEADQRVSYWAGETKRRWGRFVFLKEHYPELWNRFAVQFPEVRSFC